MKRATCLMVLSALSCALVLVACNSASAARTMLFEDFDDGVANGFSVVGGSWTVQEGKYVQSTQDPPGPYRSWVNAGELTEYTIEVDCTPLSGGETKVIYAHGDTTEDYRVDFWLDRSRLSIPAWGQPWDTRNFEVGGLSLSNGQAYCVRVEVSFTCVRVWVENVLQHEQPWANEVPLGDGKVGVGTHAATSNFDNLVVYAGTLGPTAFCVLDNWRAEEGAVSLNWNNLGSNFVYTVEFRDSLTEGGWSPVLPLGQWPSSATRWTDASAPGFPTRFYRIKTEALLYPPSSPSDVTGTAAEGEVILRWNQVPGASSYTVYWSTNEDFSKLDANKIEGVVSPFSHTGPTPGTTYYYAVAAVGNKGESDLSSRISAGPPPSLDRIEEAVHGLPRYHFRIEHRPGVAYEGEMDQGENRQYVQIGVTDQEFPVAESFWTGDRGYGRRLEFDGWFNIRADTFQNHLQTALELLRRTPIVASREEGPFWVFGIRPPADLPLISNPEEFWREILREATCPDEEEFLVRAVQLSQGLEMSLEVRISREDFLIREIALRCQARDMRYEMTTTFGPSQMEIPPLPPKALEADSPEIPGAMLLVRFDTLGGWCETENHCPWAERSISLIQKEDTNAQYAEIYHTDWFKQKYSMQIARAGVTPTPTLHHPIVLGAYYEDTTGLMPTFYHQWFSSWPEYQNNPNFYFDPSFPSGYKRYYHHYGGENLGLEYAWYFWFHGPPSTTVGSRYYSARDWGYGCNRISPNQSMNRLTFTDAIEQYNRYSFEGKRNAYLILGHAVHLLQDQGQPDHAKLVPHPGSAKDEEEAYSEYKYCEVVAAEFAAAALAACSWAGPWAFACAGGAYGIAYGACKASIDKNEMGYEALISRELPQCPLGSWELKRVESQINQSGVLPRSNYDTYFSDMSNFSKTTANQFGLSSALGCGTLKLIPPIPGADPDIESDEADQVKPYFELTDKLVTRIVGSGAGLIEHFYDIVNYPPYVERLAMVQWEPGSTPRGFADFGTGTNPCKRYDAEWVMSGSQRVLMQPAAQPLSLDRPAYVFVLFGPTGIAPEGKGRMMDLSRTSVRFVGTYPLTGEPIDEEVTLTLASDPTVGPYYWGTYWPHNCGSDPYWLFLEIQGKDTGAHFAGRQPAGGEIDANPDTIATVDACQPNYPWVDYEPGTDKHHKVQIALMELTTDFNPKSVVLPIGRDPMAEVTMQVQQKAWDCNWEPYWASPTCPVQWELDPQVTKLGRPPETGLLEDFGFQVQLNVGHDPGTATLVIRRNATTYTPGEYEMKVYCTVGEPGHEWFYTFIVPVELE